MSLYLLHQKLPSFTLHTFFHQNLHSYIILTYKLSTSLYFPTERGSLWENNIAVRALEKEGMKDETRKLLMK